MRGFYKSTWGCAGNMFIWVLDTGQTAWRAPKGSLETSQGHSFTKRLQVHAHTHTDTQDTHDWLVVSCTTTSAGNEAVVISGTERKLRLAVCRAVSLLCRLISGGSKATKPQATSQSADCCAARLLFKACFRNGFLCFVFINTVVSDANISSSFYDICIPQQSRTNEGLSPEQITSCFL